MAKHTVMISGTTRKIGLHLENNEIDIARTIIGMLTYMVFLAPVFSLLVVSVLNLNSAYILPIFIILLMAGMYITEKYCCRNIH